MVGIVEIVRRVLFVFAVASCGRTRLDGAGGGNGEGATAGGTETAARVTGMRLGAFRSPFPSEPLVQ